MYCMWFNVARKISTRAPKHTHTAEYIRRDIREYTIQFHFLHQIVFNALISRHISRLCDSIPAAREREGEKDFAAFSVSLFPFIALLLPPRLRSKNVIFARLSFKYVPLVCIEKQYFHFHCKKNCYFPFCCSSFFFPSSNTFSQSCAIIRNRNERKSSQLADDIFFCLMFDLFNRMMKNTTENS